ncbi:MAG: YeeE/YedE family protein [bacterium]|jgi:uncharacterized membrane protein YedE/YeeE
MQEFSVVGPLVGGVLIGIASAMMMYFNGRIAGISGIFEGVIKPASGDFVWRAAFVGGIVGGGLLMLFMTPESFADVSGRPVYLAGLAGLLVGIGTRIGSGCTSGHGVCGVSRMAPRSLVATGTFMATGILTVWLVGGVAQ